MYLYCSTKVASLFGARIRPQLDLDHALELEFGSGGITDVHVTSVDQGLPHQPAVRHLHQRSLQLLANFTQLSGILL